METKKWYPQISIENKYINELRNLYLKLSKINYGYDLSDKNPNYIEFLNELDECFLLGKKYIKFFKNNIKAKNKILSSNIWNEIYDDYQDFHLDIKKYLYKNDKPNKLTTPTTSWQEFLILLSQYDIRLPKEIYNHIKINWKN